MAETGTTLFLDNESDIIVSLKIVNWSLQQVNNDSDYWKWVIIALHSAIQNAMIVALVSVNTALVYSPDSFAKWQKLDNHPGLKSGIKEFHIDDFLCLFCKLKKYSTFISTEDTSSWLDDSTKKNMQMLNSVRNDFHHFGYKCWIISIMHLRNLTECGLSFLELLLKKTSSVIFTEREDLNQVSRIISDCRETITNL